MQNHIAENEQCEAKYNYDAENYHEREAD